MDFDVKKIAKLAKIRITHEVELKLEKSIKEITHMLEKLDKVDFGIDKNEKLEDVLLSDLPEMKYRDDIVNISLDNKSLMDNAPKCMADYIVVPKIVE